VPSAADLQPFRKAPEILELAVVGRRRIVPPAGSLMQIAAWHLLRASHFAKRAAAPLAGGKPFG